MRQESAFRINAAKEAFDAAVRVVKEELSIAWHAYERQRKLVPFLSDKAVANRKTRETYCYVPLYMSHFVSTYLRWDKQKNPTLLRG